MAEEENCRTFEQILLSINEKGIRHIIDCFHLCKFELSPDAHIYETMHGSCQNQFVEK